MNEIDQVMESLDPKDTDKIIEHMRKLRAIHESGGKPQKLGAEDRGIDLVKLVVKPRVLAPLRRPK